MTAILAWTLLGKVTHQHGETFQKKGLESCIIAIFLPPDLSSWNIFIGDFCEYFVAMCIPTMTWEPKLDNPMTSYLYLGNHVHQTQQYQNQNDVHMDFEHVRTTRPNLHNCAHFCCSIFQLTDGKLGGHSIHTYNEFNACVSRLNFTQPYKVVLTTFEQTKTSHVKRKSKTAKLKP